MHLRKVGLVDHRAHTGLVLVAEVGVVDAVRLGSEGQLSVARGSETDIHRLVMPRSHEVRLYRWG